MSSIGTYNRNSFSVEAARVTVKNLYELAEKFGGVVVKDMPVSADWYIRWTVGGDNWQTESCAYQGDWMVKQDNHTAQYTDKQFRSDFKRRLDLLEAIRVLVNDDRVAAQILNLIEVG